MLHLMTMSYLIIINEKYIEEFFLLTLHSMFWLMFMMVKIVKSSLPQFQCPMGVTFTYQKMHIDKSGSLTVCV